MTNSSIHRIRLQGPWEAIPPGGDPGEEPMRVSIPASWRELFGERSGTAVFRRRFNSPTGLEDGDRLLVRLPEGLGQVDRASINGVILHADCNGPLAFDVTRNMSDFNLLELRLTCNLESTPEDRGGLWRPVLLEIHGGSESSRPE